MGVILGIVSFEWEMNGNHVKWKVMDTYYFTMYSNTKQIEWQWCKSITIIGTWEYSAGRKTDISGEVNRMQSPQR